MENGLIEKKKIKELRSHLNDLLPLLTVVKNEISVLGELKLGSIDKKIDLSKAIITICLPAVIGVLSLNNLPLNKWLFTFGLGFITAFALVFWIRLLRQRDELIKTFLDAHGERSGVIAAVLNIHQTLLRILGGSIEDKDTKSEVKS